MADLFVMSDPTGPDNSTQARGERPSIVNGLLCSIMRARSRNSSRSDLASEINRESSEAVISYAWTILFSFFSDVIDKNQKKKIIEIRRETTLKQVEDILNQLYYISEISNLSSFYKDLPMNPVLRFL